MEKISIKTKEWLFVASMFAVTSPWIALLVYFIWV